MSWGEAVRQTRTIGQDPTSQLAAAVNGWQAPVSPIYLALKTLNDNFVATKTDRRAKLAALRDPFAPPPKRYGNASLTIPELRALLDRNREEANDGG